MLYSSRKTLAELTRTNVMSADRFISDSKLSLSLETLDATAKLRSDTKAFFGRNVMIRTRGQLAFALGVLALDGVAHRLLLCPPDVPDAQIPCLMQEGEADLIITDDDIRPETCIPSRQSTATSLRIDTEWVLFTSGTSGLPKLVQHSLTSLSAPIHDGLTKEYAVWGTFYDIRRYGGLQILLRALICGGSIVLSDSDEPVDAFLARLGDTGVTHVSGTPSHWRRALMSGAAARMEPSYVRLSGEMAGQDILDRLRVAYPQARVGHAYASTEAGVAFSVDDGRAGFPSAVLDMVPPRPIVRIENGTLRVHSNAMATSYLGQTSRALTDDEGFVDTGDMVECHGDRYIFVGRREGVVNVGGLKVHPEEVEATINRHPAVAMSRVWGRASPITGTLIAADIVLTPDANGKKDDFARIRAQIIEACRAALPPHKVPVRLTEVTEIPVMTSGKIERRHA